MSNLQHTTHFTILLHYFPPFYLLSDVTHCVTQRHAELSSLLLHLDKSTKVAFDARVVIHKLITNPINSSVGINLSLDTPLNNRQTTNIGRPGALRQYFADDVVVIRQSDTFVCRFTYGFGSGTSSVGMDPTNFMTRKMTLEMNDIAVALHNMLLSNRQFFNLESVDLLKCFNHCTVILYYAGEDRKAYSSLGYHSDCGYH